MQTQYLVTVTHHKSLPADAAGEIERKVYGWCYAKGVEVNVTAKLHEVQKFLPLEELRCIGHGSGASGHQNRVDCVHCLRRLAPRPSGVRYLPLPMEFPCPQRIGANE